MEKYQNLVVGCDKAVSGDFAWSAGLQTLEAKGQLNGIEAEGNYSLQLC